MSFERMAFRLAVLESLAPEAQVDALSANLPTAVGPHVYDSRFTPVDAIKGQHVPVINVSIEEMQADARSKQNGGGVFDGWFRIVFDITAYVRETVDDEESIVIPETDAELEDLLDVIEEQIAYVLDNASLVQKCRARVSRAEVQIFRDPDAGFKLAVRGVSYFVEPVADGQGVLAWLATKLTGERKVRALRALDALRATDEAIFGPSPSLPLDPILHTGDLAVRPDSAVPVDDIPAAARVPFEFSSS